MDDRMQILSSLGLEIGFEAQITEEWEEQFDRLLEWLLIIVSRLVQFHLMNLDTKMREPRRRAPLPESGTHSPGCLYFSMVIVKPPCRSSYNLYISALQNSHNRAFSIALSLSKDYNSPAYSPFIIQELMVILSARDLTFHELTFSAKYVTVIVFLSCLSRKIKQKSLLVAWKVF